MITNKKDYHVRNINYTIRSAKTEDALDISQLRVQIDGETENLDREPGEAYIDELGFKQLIKNDTENKRNLFLVAEVQNKIVGFSRCEGHLLKRFNHKVEFGVCVQKDYWGYGIGKNLLQQSIEWADSNNIKKITLNVLEINKKAIALYQSVGFEIEGTLIKDKILSDGHYYNTIIMGRFHEETV